jgi:hypothetical protein
MTAPVYTGLLTRNQYMQYFSQSLWGQYSRYSFATAQKTQFVVTRKLHDVSQITSKHMRLLAFSEFKQTQVETFDQFMSSPCVKELYKTQDEALKAYQAFCRSQYALYKRMNYGGNPTQVI